MQIQLHGLSGRGHIDKITKVDRYYVPRQIVAKQIEKGAANEHDTTLSDSFVFIKFRNNIRSTTSVPTGLTIISLLPSFGLVKSPSRLQVIDP